LALENPEFHQNTAQNSQVTISVKPESLELGTPLQPIQLHNLNPYPDTLELKSTLKFLDLEKTPINLLTPALNLKLKQNTNI